MNFTWEFGLEKINTAIGLMSGTSMDGIDVVLLRTDGQAMLDRGPGQFFPYASETRKLLVQAMEAAKILQSRDERSGILEQTEREVTRQHETAVLKFLLQTGLQPQEVDLIGFHGQTVLHKPEVGLTIQLGDGQALANATGISTVHDMRANDMVHGGQGAPLAPAYHKALASNLPDALGAKRPVVFVNIGGISNITFVGDELIAFDTGPGNALIDQWVQRHVGIAFDEGGMIAAQGSVDRGLVDAYLASPFFAKPGPKSLDRGDFELPIETGLPIEVVARSLARVTAEAIMRSTDHLAETPSLWIICGGGRKNPQIMGDLMQLVLEQDARAITAEEAGFDGDMMEAEAWAYLAVRSLKGLPLTYPGTTGVKSPAKGGIISHSS